MAKLGFLLFVVGRRGALCHVHATGLFLSFFSTCWDEDSEIALEHIHYVLFLFSHSCCSSLSCHLFSIFVYLC